jgi:transcriptional regulator with GAF, ATPase, and Fis domain
MSTTTKEARLLEIFVKLADTLVADYDVVDLMQSLVEACRDLFEFSEAGILLSDTQGRLDVIASTNEGSRLVELMQLSAEGGPCVESFQLGAVVAVPDIDVVDERWTKFRDAARAQGYVSVYAIPMRLRENTIGALNLFRASRGELDDTDLQAAQALADVATIGILHERSIRESAIVQEQLQRALNSRVVIEQAKGVISQTRGGSVEDAFDALRSYARDHRRGISEVAAEIIDRSLVL